MKYTYKLEDGREVPLFEADYDMSFDVYKTDKKKAVIGDPRHCIEAVGLCRLQNVTEAHIGASKVAIVVFGPTASRDFVHAVRFIIPASSAKVRDKFDLQKSLKSQTLRLSAPTKGQTMERDRVRQKARREAIKAGAEIKKRGKPNRNRMQRIGVKQRPRALVTKNGTVSFI